MLHPLISSKVHPQWIPFLNKALLELTPDYIAYLQQHEDWLPGFTCLFAAFSEPAENVQYLLLGESPYPRTASANGYAFWDNAVHALWSPKGLSREVNRATSLRNFIKMLLVARGDLSLNTSQIAIADLDKSRYCQTATELFQHMLQKGFLLLNATPVYVANEVRWHAKQWQPFMRCLFNELKVNMPHLKVLLFGKIAAEIPEVNQFSCLKAEHPYNLSFIHNPDVLSFFTTLDLLGCYEI